MDIVTEWKRLVGDIRDAALGMFANSEVARTECGFADEKVLALTLLARTVSNVKGALLLLDAKRIVEARTITRCAFENLYWIVGWPKRAKRSSARCGMMKRATAARWARRFSQQRFSSKTTWQNGCVHT